MRSPRGEDVRHESGIELSDAVTAVADVLGIDRRDHDERCVASEFLFDADAKQLGLRSPPRTVVWSAGQRFRPGCSPSTAWTATKWETEPPRSETDSIRLNASCEIERCWIEPATRDPMQDHLRKRAGGG